MGLTNNQPTLLSGHSARCKGENCADSRFPGDQKEYEFFCTSSFICELTSNGLARSVKASATSSSKLIDKEEHNFELESPPVFIIVLVGVETRKELDETRGYISSKKQSLGSKSLVWNIDFEILTPVAPNHCLRQSGDVCAIDTYHDGGVLAPSGGPTMHVTERCLFAIICNRIGPMTIY